MMSRDRFVFLIMVACGAAVSFMFDIFRAFRIAAEPPAIVVAVSDALFCASALFISAACVWNFNDGAFRAYEVIGLLLGGIFYFLLVSRWILKLFLLIIENILKFVRLIFKILLTPSRFLYKILIVPLRKRYKNMIQRSREADAKRVQKQNH